MRRCLHCRGRLEQAATGRRRRYCSDAHRKAAHRQRTRRDRPFYATSGNDEWATPQGLFEELDAEFGFTLDAAATAENAKCARFFTRGEAGLARPWAGAGFVNPPYSEVGRWVAHGWLAAQAEGATVVLLVPARTDTVLAHRAETDTP